MEKDSSSSGRNLQILGAALLGAAAGAVIALLFAPGKGSETRKKVAEGAAELADRLKEKIKNNTGEGPGKEPTT